MADEQIDPLENPDLEHGPLSEIPFEQRYADWEEASAAWRAMSEEERQQLLSALEAAGQDPDEYLAMVNTPPSPDD